MKYNLSSIMKRAWALVKKVGLNISVALKKAWREAKEGTMKGTEKQIAYATDLLSKLDEHFRALIADCPADKKDMWVQLLDGIHSIASESYAGDLIDILKIHESNHVDYYRTFSIRVRIRKYSHFAESVCGLIKKLSQEA